MSAKMTGRRTPLTLSQSSKLSLKPSTPNANSDNNRNKEPGTPKTETEKSTKDKKAESTNLEKKFIESNSSSSSFKRSETSFSRNSTQSDEKKSQNGVSNGSGNTKNQNSAKSDGSGKQERATAANKQQQQNTIQHNKVAEKEKPSKKIDTNLEKKQDTPTSCDLEKMSQKSSEVRLTRSSPLSSSGSSVAIFNEGEAKIKNLSNETKGDLDEIKKGSINVDSDTKNTVNAPSAKASTPTRNKKKSDDTPESKNKLNEVLNAKNENKSGLGFSTPNKNAIDQIIEIDDDEMMEPIVYTVDDFKSTSEEASTLGKIVKRKDGPPIPQTKIPSTSNSQWNSSPEHKTSNYAKFIVSGRRSIHPNLDYQPIQGYYRRTKTDLDSSYNSNTSLNVTVGSEAPNNSSFSFFGHGRKRDRTPANSQSELELVGDNELSPKSPKRARVDVSGFFSAVVSPLSKLRARFSRTTIQSSTPMKQSKVIEDNENVIKSSDVIIDNDVQFNSDNDVTVDKEENENQQLSNDTEDILSKNNSKNDEDAIQKVSSKDESQSDKVKSSTSGTEQIPVAESGVDDILVTITPADEEKKSNCSIM